MWFWLPLAFSLIASSSAGPRQLTVNRDDNDPSLTLHRYQTTWMEARKLCQRSQSDLVLINTQDKQREVESFLDTQRFQGKVWIGATDFLVEDKWYWTNGEHFTFSNWAVGEPNDDANQDCLQADALTGKWDDAGCEQQRSFLCEPRWEPKVVYKFHETKSAWASAQRTCEAEGGFLAIVDRPDFHLDVALRYHGPRDFWIGGANFLDDHGRDVARPSRDWRWINGLSVKTANWAYGVAPKDDSPLCMVDNYYGYGQLYGKDCGEKKPFLCAIVETAPCEVSPCLNGGSCVDSLNQRRCLCEPGFVGEDCEMEVDDCLSNPCLNGGICHDERLGFKCSCLPGFRGRLCETNVNECASSPCLNYGTCLDGVNGFICRCPPQFGGRLCHEPLLDPCRSRPCRNNGVCLSGPMSYFECVCAPGFNGPTCDANVDECASSPCQNGGTCVDGIAGYACSCLRGYHGPDCRHRLTYCNSQPCLHGGVCEEDDQHGFRCHCPEGIRGRFCEDAVDECQESPCQNGATCINNLATYNCICPPNVFGNNCQMDYNELVES